jgi:hypothetical protein
MKEINWKRSYKKIIFKEEKEEKVCFKINVETRFQMIVVEKEEREF